jgi:hypothetical protein
MFTGKTELHREIAAANPQPKHGNAVFDPDFLSANGAVPVVNTIAEGTQLGNIPAAVAVAGSSMFGLVCGLSINSLVNKIKK